MAEATRARSTVIIMEELEQQREALENGILQEQIEKPPITREQILFWFDQFRHGDPADIAFQEKVIDCFVNSIYLFDDRIVVNFNYQEGGRPLSLEEVLGSFLDGNGAPRRANSNSCWLFSSCCHCLSQRRWADAGGVSPSSFAYFPELESSEKREHRSCRQ